MTARIFLKLIFAVFSVLIVALLAVDFFATRIAERSYIDTLKRELEEKGRVLALLPEADLLRQCHTLAHAANARVTVINASGRVLADSEADPEHMENHRGRPELQDAWRGQVGTIIRKSSTIGVSFLYVAVPVRSGALRLAVPISQISAQVNEIRKKVLGATAFAFLPSIVMAAFFSRYFSRRLAAIIEYARKLAEGDFRARLSWSGGDELGVLGSRLNETGEKLQRMFEELEREQVELEKLERIRKDFVINVSHELRTPLASIQGYTDTLLEGALHDPDHNVRFLTIIKQNAERLGRLTADLLTLSRLELKTQKFHSASYYVNVLLEQNIDSMKPMADKKDIAIELQRAPEEIEVFCDSEAVHQILSNLMDNALKYTPSGGIIYVSATHLARTEPERVEISVRDTGSGIPQEELPRLFERFYRVDKARSRELGGTGLGLAIVKHLVRAQGGEVRVASEVNLGSTFTFTLPVHDLGLQETVSLQGELTAS